MSPKDPDSKRYLSAHKRGYRTINLTPDEQKELTAAALDAGKPSVKEYLFSLHRTRKA